MGRHPRKNKTPFTLPIENDCGLCHIAATIDDIDPHWLKIARY